MVSLRIEDTSSWLPYSIISYLPVSDFYTLLWARVCGLCASVCHLGTPGSCTQRQNPSLLQEGGSAPWLPPPPYAPVGVSGWYLPGLDALQGTLAPHHHAQVGVPIGVVALGLSGAMGPTGPARGKQPVNCGTRGKTITHLAWPSFLYGPPWAASELSAQWPQAHIPRRHQGWGKKHHSVI